MLHDCAYLIIAMQFLQGVQVQVSMSTALLLLTLVLLGQYSDIVNAINDEEESESEEQSLEHILAGSVQVTIPGDEAGINNNIRLKGLKIGYEIGYQISSAPTTGKVILSLIDDTKNAIVLNVAARYNTKELILNTWKPGTGWGQWISPPGFDFTSGKSSLVTVRAENAGFYILQNGKMIALFQYRSGLPVTSVTRIRIHSGGGNQAAKDAMLIVKFN